MASHAVDTSKVLPEGNWLYAFHADEFIRIAQDGKQIAALLSEHHLAHFMSPPDPREVLSWERSLPIMANVLKAAGMHDQLVLLEYCPPSRDKWPCRVDMVICGKDANHKTHAVLLELKQWSNIPMRRTLRRGIIRLRMNGKWVKKANPRTQVEDYRRHMQKILKICGFPEDFIVFSAYAYLHNAHDLSHKQKLVLFGKNDGHDEDTRLYTKEYTGALVKRLRECVSGGHGDEAFAAFKQVQSKAIEHIKALPKRKYSLFVRMLWKWGYNQFFRDQVTVFFLFVILPLSVLIGFVTWVIYAR